MAELITCPTFEFKQGDIFSGVDNAEKSIHVDFYNGSIQLRQDGEYDQQEKILILPENLDKLFKEIKKHLPDALVMLKK